MDNTQITLYVVLAVVCLVALKQFIPLIRLFGSRCSGYFNSDPKAVVEPPHTLGQDIKESIEEVKEAVDAIGTVANAVKK